MLKTEVGLCCRLGAVLCCRAAFACVWSPDFCGVVLLDCLWLLNRKLCNFVTSSNEIREQSHVGKKNIFITCVSTSKVN